MATQATRLVAIDDDGRGMEVERLRQIARNLFRVGQGGGRPHPGEKADPRRCLEDVASRAAPGHCRPATALAMTGGRVLSSLKDWGRRMHQST
jgi:hypothetical protein